MKNYYNNYLDYTTEIIINCDKYYTEIYDYNPYFQLELDLQIQILPLIIINPQNVQNRTIPE